MSATRSRDEALALLFEYTAGDSLRKHALAVEAVMRAYGRHYGEDEETWGLVGLLHDFDYEQYPEAEDHPLKGSEILRQRGYPDEIIRAIQCHAPYLGVERRTMMEKSILSCDELVGLITAVALVRPSKSIREVEVNSIKKKLKDKAFARSVNRQDIYLGVEEMSIDLTDHLQFVLDAMKQVAGEIGLA